MTISRRFIGMVVACLLLGTAGFIFWTEWTEVAADSLDTVGGAMNVSGFGVIGVAEESAPTVPVPGVLLVVAFGAGLIAYLRRHGST